MKRMEISGNLIARNAVLNLIGQAVPMIVDLKRQVNVRARWRRFRARSLESTSSTGRRLQERLSW